MSKNKSIFKGLDRAYESLLPDDIIDSETATSKFVIFSDHHRGVRDKSDDFLRCEATYSTALKYYFERDFSLILLGDVEDLWECRSDPVIKAYTNIFTLEAEFYQASEERYYRIHGNHDDYWGETGFFRFDGKQRTIRDKLLIRFHNKGHNSTGKIFLVHGHQGDHLRKISKMVIRYIWRPFQRVTGIRTTTPARDSALRGQLNKALYNWALKKNLEHEKLILISGHTHSPVFASEDHTGKINSELNGMKEKLEEARISGDSEIIDLENKTKEKQLELNRRKEKENMSIDQDGISMERPCYFNSGCCSFRDGDLTALEIADGNITLVKWERDNQKPKIFETAGLGNIFSRL